MRLSIFALVAWACWLLPLSAQGPLAPAAWLAGDWVLIEGSRCTEEHWTAPSRT